ncbi:hypothetical protein [Sebaldella termitidis]|uniref:hypothetical protein n=1 Tax=Sebaldella termitidis TaxID=826 RepID=UPI003EBFEA64
MAEAIEKIGAKEGYEVEVIYTDSLNGKLLDGKEGNAWFDENTGKITILINTEAEGIGNKDKLAGVLAEELSHGINEANGKNKGSGTETLAGHSNDYFSGKLGDSNTSLSLIGDGKDYNNVDFGTHVGDKAILNTTNTGKKDKVNDILSNLKSPLSYTSMTENEMKKIVKALQGSTADELGYKKIGDTYYIVVVKEVPDDKIGLDLSREEREFYIQKTHEWRDIITKDDKNAYFQVNSNAEANNASVNINPNDIKYEGGKYVVDDTVVLFNKDNMKKENYVSIPVRLNPVTGEWIYQDMNLKNVMNHEGIHITDDLLNGMAIEKKNGILQNIMHTENNILFYKKGQTFITDIVTPMSEIRAMEHEGKLSIINREGLVDREIYSPGNLKNSRPVF